MRGTLHHWCTCCGHCSGTHHHWPKHRVERSSCETLFKLRIAGASKLASRSEVSKPKVGTALTSSSPALARNFCDSARDSPASLDLHSNYAKKRTETIQPDRYSRGGHVEPTGGQHRALSVGLGIPRNLREQDGIRLRRDPDVHRNARRASRTAWISTFMAGTLSVTITICVISVSRLDVSRAQPRVYCPSRARRVSRSNRS